MIIKEKNYLALFAKSFNWAGFFLPKDTYEECSKLYTFCRVLDDLADANQDLEIKKERFKELKEIFKEIETLKNNDLYINANDLPKLKDNEFYWKDLIGMEVYNLKDEYFGKVKEMIEAGSGDVMVIKDNREKSILIPFEYGKFVKKVKDNRIFVNWEKDD